LSHGTIFTDYFADLVEEHLGNIIEEIIEKYYEDQIDKEFEYEEILKFITAELMGTNNVDYDEAEFTKTLRKLARKKSVGRLVISYLIAKYIEERDKFLEEEDFLE